MADQRRLRHGCTVCGRKVGVDASGALFSHNAHDSTAPCAGSEVLIEGLAGLVPTLTPSSFQLVEAESDPSHVPSTRLARELVRQERLSILARRQVLEQYPLPDDLESRVDTALALQGVIAGARRRLREITGEGDARLVTQAVATMARDEALRRAQSPLAPAWSDTAAPLADPVSESVKALSAGIPGSSRRH